MASNMLGVGVKLLEGENCDGLSKKDHKVDVHIYVSAPMLCTYVGTSLLVGAKFCMCKWELGCRYGEDATRQHDSRWCKLNVSRAILSPFGASGSTCQLC